MRFVNIRRSPPETASEWPSKRPPKAKDSHFLNAAIAGRKLSVTRKREEKVDKKAESLMVLPELSKWLS